MEKNQPNHPIKRTGGEASSEPFLSNPMSPLQDQAVKILAKSMYKNLREQGLPNQKVLELAGMLIETVTASIQSESSMMASDGQRQKL